MMKKFLTIVVVLLAIVFLFSMCSDGSSSSNKSKCAICGKTATHTFQGSGYCNTHYNKAVKWAINNVSGK